MLCIFLSTTKIAGLYSIDGELYLHNKKAISIGLKDALYSSQEYYIILKNVCLFQRSNINLISDEQ
jgi:hypothetical protein